MAERPTQRLDLRHSQSLVMTQQLQQSIKLLQLSSLELASYINQELENNPLLAQQEPAEEEENDSPYDDDEEEDTSDRLSASENSDRLEKVDAGEGELRYERVSSGYESGDALNIEDNPDHDKTLRQHIIEQIYVDISCPKQRIIAFHLADLLDDNGYLVECDMPQIAETLQCAEAEVKTVLTLVQRFDPAGVFAQSLAECLRLQLADKNRLDPAMESLLCHLDLLGRGEISALKKVCQVSSEDLSDMIAEIKALNPKPGSTFISEITHTLQPDVFLKRDQEGNWLLELNQDILPKLLVNRRYYAQVKSKTRDKQERKYLSEQLYTANWLIKALDQRAQTILRVATEIVCRQSEFFEKGVRYLKPLKLSDIATALSLHESTISRVTTHKYMATHLGLYEMKYFFSSSLGSTDGEEDHSSTAVKHLIKQLIEQETATKILSDDKIAEMLKSQHINVARRTVAKYREAMRIPSSSERRRIKRLA